MSGCDLDEDKIKGLLGDDNEIDHNDEMIKMEYFDNFKHIKLNNLLVLNLGSNPRINVSG